MVIDAELAAGESGPPALIETVPKKVSATKIAKWLRHAKLRRAARDERLRDVLEGILARLRGELAS